MALTGCQKYDHRKPISREAATSYGTTTTESEGFLIGSFSYYGHHPSSLAFTEGQKKFRYNSYRLHYKGTEQREIPIVGSVGGAGSFMLKGYKEDFLLAEGEGQVFVIPLPEGEYNFDRFSFYLDEFISQKTWHSSAEMHIPFTIEKGKATYIGEVRFNHLWGTNIVGLTLPAGCYLEAIDEFSRDIALVKENYPFITKIPLSKNIITAGLETYYANANTDENQSH